jgi:hypothetical protein
MVESSSDHQGWAALQHTPAMVNPLLSKQEWKRCHSIVTSNIDVYMSMHAVVPVCKHCIDQ